MPAMIEPLQHRDGIQTRVFGPRAAETTAAGFALPRETAVQLSRMFAEKLSLRKAGPVQMLVDVPDVPASVVNVFRYYGNAAVAHVLRAPPTGDTPALVGVYVLLPGLDKDADEAAVAALESSRDKNGQLLPLPPQVYASLRGDVRPLLAMLFFEVEAVKDVSLRLLAVTLAEAFFESMRKAQADGK
jgi:hypothetical protein